MTTYHIKQNGTPGVCHAKTGNCPLGGTSLHFDTAEQAEHVSQAIMEAKYGLGEDIYVESQEESQKENNTKEIEEIEEVEEVEEVKPMEKYISESELAESKRIMRGRTMYTINQDMEIVETETVRCNPSSYDYNALKLFLEHNRETLEEYHSVKDNNDAISGYVCGYNRTKQDDFIEGWADEGVRVF